MGPVIGAAVLTLLPEMLHDFDKFRLIVYGASSFSRCISFRRRHGPVRAGRQTVQAAGAVDSGKLQTSTPAKPPALAERVPRWSLIGVACLWRPPGAQRGQLPRRRQGPSTPSSARTGPGKTTLINIITGFYRADAGRVLVDGRPVFLGSMSAAARHGIARTFQTIKLFGDMTVLEHVMVGFARHSRSGIWSAVVRGPGSKEETRRNAADARELIRFVGLDGFEDRPANALPTDTVGCSKSPGPSRCVRPSAA